MFDENKQSDMIAEDLWSCFHVSATARQKLETPIMESWARSFSFNVDCKAPKMEMWTHAEFEVIRKASRPLYIYSLSPISDLIVENNSKDFGVILFDPSGTVIHVEGAERFSAWAQESGIVVSTVWSEETIGMNPFSIGIKQAAPMALAGECNFSRFLISHHYYFCSVQESGKCLGGVLIVTGRDDMAEHMLKLVKLLARNIELQFFWFNFSAKYNDINQGTGTLSLDQSTGENRIIIMSPGVFKIFEIPKKTVFYESLKSVINPLPANKEFWDIINHRKIVSDEPIQIEIQGNKILVNVSSALFAERRFHIDGIALSFNSISHINKLVSRYSGNVARYHFVDIIGSSHIIIDAIKRSEIASRSESSILLLGESGVGKDIFAQSIHNSSARRNKPFVALNCAAFSKELIASELFGYESGAFTGAKKEGAIGKFELANGGTLFLDEIGDMPLDLQAILLRVLDEKAFRKVGGNTVIPIDIRIIAATNKNLIGKMEQGTFRQDLFFRLGVIRINIPPLRERDKDVLMMAQKFIHVICGRLGKAIPNFTKEATQLLRRYSWPGNVRELHNVLEGVISTYDESTISVSMFENYIANNAHCLDSAISIRNYEMANIHVDDLGDDAGTERKNIEEALQRFRGNKVKAAAYLRMSRSTFYRRLKEYALLE